MKRWKPELKGNNGQDVFLYPDHSKPMTRRELLAAGVIDSAIFVAMPSLLSLVSRPAYALPVPKFLVMSLDVSGGSGATTHGTFVAQTATGAVPAQAALNSMIATNALAGAGNPSATGSIVETYGAPMWNSLMVQQLQTLLPDANVRSRIRIANFLAQTNDDTNQNQHSSANMVSAAIAMLNQEFYPVQSAVAVGGNRDSGQNSQSPVISARRYGYLQVNNNNSVREAISSPFSVLSSAQAERVLSGLIKLAEERMGSAKEKDGSRGIASTAKGGFEKNLQNLKDAAAIITDPRTANGGLAAATRTVLDTPNLGLNANEKARFESALFAAVSGISWNHMTFVMGGGDYHDNTAASSQNFIRRKTAYLAAAITECNARGIPLFVTMITDGGMRTRNGLYVSDEGRFGMSQVLAFHPTKVPELSRAVIGASDPNTGFALTNNLTGGSPRMLAVALFANVIAGLKQSGLVNRAVEQVVRQVVGDATLGNASDADIRSLLAFKA